MKAEFQTSFKESGIKAETYFANTMSIGSLYNNKVYKVVMRIETDYMDCSINMKISNTSFGIMVENLKNGVSDFALIDKNQDRMLSIQTRIFNDTRITFIRCDICNQPVCCFKMTEDQIKQLIDLWSDENGRI